MAQVEPVQPPDSSTEVDSRMKSEKDSGVNPATAKVPPIPLPGEGHRLTSDRNKTLTAWLTEQFILGLRDRNPRAAWLEDAVAFVREMTFFVNVDGARTPYTRDFLIPPEALLEKGKTLIAKGASDPILFFLQGWIENVAKKNSAERVKKLADTWVDLLNGPEMPVIHLLVTNWLRLELGRLGADTYQTALDACNEAIPELFKEAIERPTTDADAEATYETLFVGRMNSWTKSNPGAKIDYLKDAKGLSWLRDTLLGSAQVDLAWEYRGDGWANSVSSKGWQGFAEHLELARGHLTAAWEAAPDKPWAATRMIAVTMAGHGDPALDERAWFDRAVKACFDHKKAYDALLWAYRPRWGGSVPLMLEFGKACADTKRHDTLVPATLLKAVFNASEDVDDRTTIHQYPGLSPRIVEVQKAMVERGTTPEELHYLRSFLIANAMLAGDHEAARDAWKGINAKIHQEAINRSFHFGLQGLDLYAVPPLTGDSEAYKAYLEAEAAAKRLDVKEGMRLFNKALAAPTVAKDPNAPRFLRGRMAAMLVEEKLSKGDWVTLDKGQTYQLWRAYYGTSQGNGPGMLLVRPTENGYQKVILQARMGMDFEIRAQLDNAPAVTDPQFGVVFGYRYGVDSYMAAICGNTGAGRQEKGAAVIKRIYASEQIGDTQPAVLTNQSKVHVRLHKGILTMWVDEKEVLKTDVRESFPSRDPWSEPDPYGNLIGFGSPLHPKGAQRLRDIEIRRIPADEAP